MNKNLGLGLLLILVLFISACSTINIQRPRAPEKLEILKKIQTDFVPKKCLYSSINKTLFVWENGTNVIHIYNNGNLINTIGGMGFDAQNFNKLADITLSSDGNLLALDSFQKKIKKFDMDGKFITGVSINEFIEPTLFAAAVDETYYIYDNSLKEIVITRTFTRSNWFTFGKFQFNSASKISLGKDEISVYDDQQNSTLVFGTLGRFQAEYEDNVQIEKKQHYVLKDHYILHPKTNSKFAISTNKWVDFSIEDRVVIFSDNEIWIGKFIYSNLNEK